MSETELLEREWFLRLPTKAEWKREMEYHGWTGPDGSAASRDNIEGIVIGTESAEFDDSTLPANLHDWRYQMGRRKKLGKALRKAADEGYRDGCLEQTSILVGFSGWKARRRAWIRYRVLRVPGVSSWERKR